MSTRHGTTLGVTALLAATAALVLVAVALRLRTGADGSTWLLVCAIAVGFAAAGALIALREPRNAIGWLFLGTGVAAGASALARELAAAWVDDGTGPELPGKLAASYEAVSWMPFVLVPSTFLLLLFPDGCALSPRWRWFGWIAGAGIPAAVAGGLLEPGPLQDHPELDNPLGVEGLAEPLAQLGWVAIALGILGSAASLVVRFRRAEGVPRAQLKWLAYAGAVVATTVIVSVALYDTIGATAANVAIMASVLALAGATGVAILRHRLYDIDLVISRTLVYAVLTAALAGAFAAVSILAGVAAGAGSELRTAAATLAVALAFRPLRTWVQDRVDRRFDRRRWVGVRKVERFLDDVRAGRAAPEAVGQVLAEALEDPGLELHFWLADTREFVDAAGHVVPQPAAGGRTSTPVRRGPVQLASVVHDGTLDARPNLVSSVIDAAGFAIEVARLRVEVRRRLAEVEESRARIVAVGDEQRRRIERDLHDGAQQRLVSLGLALRDIQSRLPAQSDAARELDASVGELAAAIDELRELARGVRPAGLDDGLAAALRGLAARASLRTHVEATEERFDDSIETAAYFVCSEALANAIKHARATRVSIGATRTDGRLTVSVSDDGIGGARVAGGLGLLGLSDRVAALGGSVTVDSEPGRGTKITAELPCGS
ncbi:ATP-binding protein [Conexibacter sp. SYSU D00693]|uniref:sensor histidine kinase n=1 Tax=Conexibacter sp. SYSU D00693 TaxID=2812560 RepID=UPI00196BB17B|nr:ATP-binding protein [Conexibacter sp. SYSU D00693]